jgi:hypothetical protein
MTLAIGQFNSRKEGGKFDTAKAGFRSVSCHEANEDEAKNTRKE